MNDHQPRWLLEELQDHPISKSVKVIFDIGANVYEEEEKFNRLYPQAEDIVLFEPIPEQANGILKQKAEIDPRITVVNCAIADFNSDQHPFQILGPVDCNFSAITNLTDGGRQISPTIDHRGTIQVKVRQLGTAMLENDLPNPDLLHMDVHGAEYGIFVDLINNDFDVIDNVKMIYCEVSSIEFYEGQHTLDEIKKVLEPYFEFVHWNEDGGWTRIGNCLFVKRGLL